MADAMLSSAAGRLIGLIEEQARNHVNLVIGAEEEVHSLAEELNTIRYVLDDAENRRFKDNNVNYWLSKLEHASYDMEDVLDQWNHAILKLAASPKQKVWSFIPSSACSCFKKVHGRDLDSDILVTKLMGDSRSIQVVSIVGVGGGLGKTTIAQVVYNHTRLEKHFDLRIWVCVSDPFDLAVIAKGIIESVKKEESPSTNNLETLWQCATGIISGKKFLLVLDDVWTEEYGKWECLESYLRKTNVAKIMGTMDEDIHYPEMLSVED